MPVYNYVRTKTRKGNGINNNFIRKSKDDMLSSNI